MHPLMCLEKINVRRDDRFRRLSVRPIKPGLTTFWPCQNIADSKVQGKGSADSGYRDRRALNGASEHYQMDQGPVLTGSFCFSFSYLPE